jgi:DNA-binding NarL/FixJ family response regulator
MVETTFHGTVTYSVYSIAEPANKDKNHFISQKSGHRNQVYVKRILIVDDSPLIRRSLRALLEQQPNWVVCGEAENGCEAIDKAKKLRPHLIVLDLAMPVLNGIEASRVLKRLMPTTQIVMFTSFTDTYIKKAALAAGPDALVDKFESDTNLISSIEQLLVPGSPPSTDEAA